MQAVVALAAAVWSHQAPAIDRAGCGTVVVPAEVGSEGPPLPANSLHPILATNTLVEQQLAQLLYRPVVWPASDVGVDWSRSLAAAIVVADGGSTYHVTLKPYDWSDGVPVTADDVLYGWEMIRALGERYTFYGFGGIPRMVASLSVTGPLDFTVRLTHPVNPDWFETDGLALLYALPRHVWGHLTIARQENLQSEDEFYRVVDGPFRLEHLELGQYASFSANHAFGGHKASIRRLVVNFQDDAGSLAALQAGQVDMVNMPYSVWNAARSMIGFNLISVGPLPAFGALILDLQSPSAPFLADLPVRQAIATAIDQERIILAIFHGQALPEQGFVPAGLTRFLAPGMSYSRSPLAYDPARAEAILAQAGWQPGADGMRRKGGVRLAFQVLTTAGSPSGLANLQLVKGDLARAGIEMTIREVQFNQIVARVAGPPSGWQAVSSVLQQSGYPDGTQLFQSGSAGNYEHYSSPEMNRLLDRAVDDPGTDGLFALERYVLKQQPLIFLPDGFATVLVRPDLGGVRQFLSPNGTWSPEDLSLHGALACH